MELTPSQLSSLNNMGIPVWALRSENTGTNKQLLGSDCVVLLETQSNKQQAQQLLKAMLFSIGLSLEQFIIINPNQLSELQNASIQPKLLLVFGEEFAQSLWGKTVVRGQAHNRLDAPFSIVVSYALEELLISPESKVLAWQDLLLAKKVLNAS